MAEQRTVPAPSPSSSMDPRSRRYTELEKWEACELARRTTIPSAVKELGLANGTLQRWLDRYPAGSRQPAAVLS